MGICAAALLFRLLMSFRPARTIDSRTKYKQMPFGHYAYGCIDTCMRCYRYCEQVCLYVCEVCIYVDVSVHVCIVTPYVLYLAYIQMPVK